MREQLFKRFFGTGILYILLTTLLLSVAYYHLWKEDFQKTLYQEANMLVAYSQSGELTSGALDWIAEKTHHTLRITVINPDGSIFYESDYKKSLMENHHDRPEIEEAEQSAYGEAERTSSTLHEVNYYVAMKGANGQIIRVARVGNPWTQFGKVMLPIIGILLLLLCVISYGGAKYISYAFMKPLESLITTWANDVYVPSDFPDKKKRGVTKEPLWTYSEMAPILFRLHRQHRELTKYAMAVAEEKNILKRILVNVREGIMLADREGRILVYNDRAESFLARLDGEMDRELVALTPLVLDSVATRLEGMAHLSSVSEDASWQEALEHMAKGKTFYSYEVDLGQKHYRVQWLGLYEGGLEERGIEPMLTGYLVMMLDMTTDFLATQRRREFTSNVSHELKTPLTTISGYSEILAHNLFQQKQEASQIGERIYQASQHMLALIDSILHLSEIENASEQLHWTHLSLQRVVTMAWQALAPKWEGKDISFALTGDSYEVYGQWELLQEVFMNLLDNAIKFSKEDQENHIVVAMRKISTAALDAFLQTTEVRRNRQSQVEHWIEITVSDEGRGMDRDTVKRIFERFYRGEESRSHTLVEGSGIGLALVKHILEAHGGCIVAKSRKEEGTTFTLFLPVDATDSEEDGR